MAGHNKYSGCRRNCARISGRRVVFAGLTCIAFIHPVLGFTFFVVDEDSIRLEVYHAGGLGGQSGRCGQGAECGDHTARELVGRVGRVGQVGQSREPECGGHTDNPGGRS